MRHYNVKKKERTKERGSIHKETNLSSVITLLCMNIFRVIQHFLHSSTYIFAHCRFTEGYTLPYEYLKKKSCINPQDSFFVYFKQVTARVAIANSRYASSVVLSHKFSSFSGDFQPHFTSHPIPYGT